MFAKAIVLIFVFLILGSLGSGLFYLVRHKKTGADVAKALTFRIGFSILLFLLLMLFYALGWIKPHGI